MAKQSDKQKQPPDPEREARFMYDVNELEDIPRDDPRAAPSPDNGLEVQSFKDSLRDFHRENRKTRIEGDHASGGDEHE